MPTAAAKVPTAEMPTTAKVGAPAKVAAATAAEVGAPAAATTTSAPSWTRVSRSSQNGR